LARGIRLGAFFLGRTVRPADTSDQPGVNVLRVYYENRIVQMTDEQDHVLG